MLKIAPVLFLLYKITTLSQLEINHRLIKKNSKFSQICKILKEKEKADLKVKGLT